MKARRGTSRPTPMMRTIGWRRSRMLLHETKIEYDTHGNPSAITDPLGNSIGMASDAAGRITETTDARGYSTQASYNSLNQLTQITDANAGQTKYNFDSRNNLGSVMNALNNTIETYGYDPIGRLATKTDALLKSESYQYDGNGNLTQITDRRNQITTIQYDARNKAIQINYADGTSQSRTYDALQAHRNQRARQRAELCLRHPGPGHPVQHQHQCRAGEHCLRVRCAG